MFLLDSTPRPGSDPGYTPGDNSQRTYKPIDGLNESEVYPSMNAGQQANPSFDGYESQNKENFSYPEFQEAQRQKEKLRMIDEAKKIMRRGAERAPERLASKLGAPKDVLRDIRNGSPEAQQRTKDFAKKKARDFASDQIGKRISNAGVKKGLEKGLSKGVGSLAKEGAKKAAGKAAGQAAAKVGTKVGAQAATKGLQAAVDVAAGATGIETLGLGFIIGLLLNIAISLGVNDAVEAGFALKDGNVKQATFLAIRAGTKIGVFLWFLVAVVLMFSVAGIFISVPILFGLNIYMILGAIPAFKKIPHLQGMVWWEIIALIVIDFIAFLIIAAFFGGIVYYLCTSTGLGGNGVSGALTSVAVSLYDWWNGGSGASFAQDICKNVNVQ